MRIRTALAVVALTGTALLTTAGTAAADDDNEGSNGSGSASLSTEALLSGLVASGNINVVFPSSVPQG